ncbi:MAG: hypothetical protein HYX68_23160 [Planctomycetes bacterium]|nr:hypothetical protein [Planctomycetota bacterium]
MKTKQHWRFVLLAACLTYAPIHGQDPSHEPIYPAPSPVAPQGALAPVVETRVPRLSGLSDWIVYKRDCCEGGAGRYTPLYTELYFGAGPSFPFGGQTLGRELQNGWSFKTGARVLFFNEPHSRAWVVDVHIVNTRQGAREQGTEFPVVVFQRGTKIEFGKNGLPGATLGDSNRTLVGVGLGRDWYPGQPANASDPRWRFGLDVGGRYGSQRLTLNEARHLTDVIGSFYTGVRSDVEIPWGHWVLHTGIRAEWAYTFSDILQRTSDVQEISLFLNAGVRY